MSRSRQRPVKCLQNKFFGKDDRINTVVCQKSTCFAIVGYGGSPPKIHIVSNANAAAMWISAQVLYRPWGIISPDGRPVQVHHGGHLAELVADVGDGIDIYVAGDQPGKPRYHIKNAPIGD